MVVPPRFDQCPRLPQRAPLFGTVVPAAAQGFDGEAPFGPHPVFRSWEANGGGAGPERHGSLPLEQAVNQFVGQAACPEQVVVRHRFPSGSVLLPRLALLLLTLALVFELPPSVLDDTARGSLAVAHGLLPSSLLVL